MKDEYAEAIAARATDALAKERADNAAGLVALLEQAKKEKRAVESERDRLRDIVRRTVDTLEQVYKHADMTDYLRADVVEMQREALAALGEDKDGHT